MRNIKFSSKIILRLITARHDAVYDATGRNCPVNTDSIVFIKTYRCCLLLWRTPSSKRFYKINIKESYKRLLHIYWHLLFVKKDNKYVLASKFKYFFLNFNFNKNISTDVDLECFFKETFELSYTFYWLGRRPYKFKFSMKIESYF